MRILGIEEHQIREKLLYRFSDHATAILPWAKIASKQDRPPLLVTLDHHTDTNSAWLRSLFQEVGRDIPRMESIREERVSKLDPKSQEDLLHSMQDLHHDEHIDLAIRLGIISGAVVIQHSFSSPLPEWKARGMEVIPFDSDHLKDENKRGFYDLALDDQWLTPLIKNLPEEIHPFKRPYILDIDLDYFKTARSLLPINSSTFTRLVDESLGITVAEEEGWVERLWLDHPPEKGELFQQLLKIILAKP